MTEGRPVSDPHADLVQLINQYGWAVRHVLTGSLPTKPPFSYTVGLTAKGHPEIVIVGLSIEYSKAFLDLVVDLVDQGERFTANEMTPKLTDEGVVAFVEVVDSSELTAIKETYGSVSALQLVWPDSAGRFPWSTGYANPPEAQPLIGSIPDEWLEN